MTTCRSCGTALRPLFSSWYCPNDCPRPRGDDREASSSRSHAADQALFGSLPRLVMPVTSYDVPDGGTATTDVRSHFSWYPQKTVFSRETLDSFRIEEVSVRIWRGSSLVLWRAHDHAHRGSREADLVDDLLRRVVVPRSVDLTFVVRNISESPRRFVCAVLCYASPCEVDLPKLSKAVLSKEDKQKVDEALARCADGSPRRDFRDPAAW